MTEWRIKEISDMTNISIRMLRHYDKIGLLKPSYRSSNGYRYYTEYDLATLQQIIALKYFGFNLKTIKAILQKSQNIYAHLQAQQQVLKRQAAHLQQVTDALGEILNGISPTEAPNWKDLITLIKGYHMSEALRDKLKKTWAGEALTESQFEDYLFLYEQFPEEFMARDKIIEQLNNKELGDPEGAEGEKVAAFMHNLAKKMKALFTQQVKLSSSLLESIKSGTLTHFEVRLEGTLWLCRATLSYWLKRWDTLYTSIIDHLSSDPEGEIGKKIAREWTGLTDDFMSVGSRSMMTGIMIWQELARQQHELKDLTIMPAPQEMVKQFHIKLLFNPEAASWISRALEVHAQ